MISIRVPPVRRCSMQVRQSFRCSDRARRVQTSPGPRTRVAARCAGGRPARDRVESRPRTGIDCTHPRIAHCPEPDRARTGAGTHAGTAARGGGGGAVSRPGRATTLNTKQRTHTPPPRLRSVPTVRAGAAAARTRAPAHHRTALHTHTRDTRWRAGRLRRSPHRHALTAPYGTGHTFRLPGTAYADGIAGFDLRCYRVHVQRLVPPNADVRPLRLGDPCSVPMLLSVSTL